MADDAPTSTLRSFPCRQCGGKLEFAPGTKSLKCPYCGTENEIAPVGEVVEEDYDATLAQLEKGTALVEARTVKCQTCGAETTAPANVTSFSCPFCGSNIVSQPQSTSRLQPHAILPFGFTREKATDSFHQWVKSRWFAPTALRSRAMLDTALTGMYVPAWTYDAKTETRYTGERGDAYYVTVGSGNNRRTERRINWSAAAGRVHDDFDDVLVLATRTLPADKAEALEPWDLKNTVVYADDYLAGFRAECYQIDLREGFGIAQQKMQGQIDSTIRADIGGDEQRIASKDTRYSAITFKHLLLPVWLAAYRYQGKVYRFLVNARTGEVQGERPYSIIKISLAVIAGLIVVGIIIYLATSN